MARATMNKNIALFFDGTWQAPKEDRTPVENTNVRKLFLRVMKADPAIQVRPRRIYCAHARRDGGLHRNPDG